MNDDKLLYDKLKNIHLKKDYHHREIRLQELMIEILVLVDISKETNEYHLLMDKWNTVCTDIGDYQIKIRENKNE